MGASMLTYREALVFLLCLIGMCVLPREGQAQASKTCPVYEAIEPAIKSDRELRNIPLERLKDRICNEPRLRKLVLQKESDRAITHTQITSADRPPRRVTSALTDPPVNSAHIVPAPQPQYAQEYGQRFYARQNNLDAFYYLYPSLPLPNPADTTSFASASKASGASFSWTENQLANTQAYNIQSYVGYVVARQLDLYAPPNSGSMPYVSKWAIAPWAYANGILNAPEKPTDKSALQFGGEAQVEISRLGPFAITDFRLAPYYQTDFRGQGDSQGFDLLIEPYNLDVLLGGADHSVLNGLAFFYWRVIGEMDVRHVNDPGLSNMLPNTQYAWMGGNLLLKTTLFPDSDNIYIANRINLTMTAQGFDSVAARSNLYNLIAEIAYNLDPAGNSSVSFQYSHGTDKSTLLFSDQYKVQLNFKM